MTGRDDRYAAVRTAELALLDEAVRRDRVRVGELLHPDFVEIGRSGRLWTKDDIVAALAAEQGRVAPDADEWSFREVGPALILVTYRITTPAGGSRHSSLWDVGGTTPVLRFHQGTPIRS